MKTMSIIKGVCLFVVMVMVIGSAGAETMNIAASSDTYVDQISGSVNFGTGNTINVKSDSIVNNRILIQFDLSALTNAVVSSANMYLYMYDAPGTARIYKVYKINGTWNETGVNWYNQPAAAASETSSAAIGTSDNVWINWDVTADIPDMIIGPNYGWKIRDIPEGAGSNTDRGRFRSREYADDTSKRPYLAVTYTCSSGWCGTLCDTGEATYYQDSDGDTFGNPDVSMQACSKPSGYVTDNSDCDDADAAIKPGASEACDGVDNDCDALTADGLDESWLGEETECGLGVCAAAGSYVCSGGVKTDTCAPGSPSGSDSDCNNIDEDCDGTEDNNFVGETTSCGIGACASTGTQSCVNGNIEDSCAAGNPSEELCNRIDDNCDGVVDDGDVCAVTTNPDIVESADQSTESDNFAAGESVYVRVKNYDNHDPMRVYIITHAEGTALTNGQTIPTNVLPSPGYVTGDVTDWVKTWNSAQLGDYDVVVDNGDGEYNTADGDMIDGITVIGFEVLPEMLTGILLSIGIASLIGYSKIKR